MTTTSTSTSTDTSTDTSADKTMSSKQKLMYEKLLSEPNSFHTAKAGDMRAQKLCRQHKYLADPVKRARHNQRSRECYHRRVAKAKALKAAQAQTQTVGK